MMILGVNRTVLPAGPQRHQAAGPVRPAWHCHARHPHVAAGVAVLPRCACQPAPQSHWHRPLLVCGGVPHGPSHTSGSSTAQHAAHTTSVHCSTPARQRWHRCSTRARHRDCRTTHSTTQHSGVVQHSSTALHGVPGRSAAPTVAAAAAAAAVLVVKHTYRNPPGPVPLSLVSLHSLTVDALAQLP